MEEGKGIFNADSPYLSERHVSLDDHVRAVLRHIRRLDHTHTLVDTRHDGALELARCHDLGGAGPSRQSDETT